MKKLIDPWKLILLQNNINIKIVLNYYRLLQDGHKFRPLEVKKYHKFYYIINGTHRAIAYRLCDNINSVECKVVRMQLLKMFMIMILCNLIIFSIWYIIDFAIFIIIPLLFCASIILMHIFSRIREIKEVRIILKAFPHTQFKIMNSE